MEMLLNGTVSPLGGLVRGSLGPVKLTHTSKYFFTLSTSTFYNLSRHVSNFDISNEKTGLKLPTFSRNSGVARLVI